MQVSSSSTMTRNREAAPHLCGLLPGCRADLYGGIDVTVPTQTMQYTVGLISDSHAVFDKVSLTQCAIRSPSPAACSLQQNQIHLISVPSHST